MRNLVPFALLLMLACEKPGVAPGLDQNTCDGGPCDTPGVIQGRHYEGACILFPHRGSGGTPRNGTTTKLTMAGNRKFESISLQRGVRCEPDFRRRSHR